MQNNLNIRGEPIQTMYSSFRQGKFIVNRRYQRKLVWTLIEKQRFIDSLVNQYPVPLFLGVEFTHPTRGACFEILDGMQRLEAITSFIEGAFPVNGQYFDLSTIAVTNKLLQEKKLVQNHPKMSFKDCNSILNYPLPISTSAYTSSEHVDETFRRINTGGIRLSRHEVRQAGSISEFPQLVRKCSIYIRGDASHSDIVDLDAMRSISLTKEDLNYGLKIRETFWNKCHILTEENILASRDEENVAHMLLHILLKDKAQTSSKFLDEVYSESTDPNKLANDAVLKYGEETIFKHFCFVFDELQKTIFEFPNSNLAEHIYTGAPQKVQQAYQVLYLACFDLLLRQNKKIQNYKSLASSIRGIATNCMGTLNSDRKWLARDRTQMIKAVCGVINQHFIPREGMDPTALSWVENLENILNQSRTENVCYDFKIGLHSLDGSGDLNNGLLTKIIRTLTAMANSHTGDSYVIIGVADNHGDAQRHDKTYQTTARKYENFYVTGIGAEASKHHKSLDSYQQKMHQLIEKEAISDVKRMIQRNTVFIKYYEKDVVLMKISRGKQPYKFKNQIFIRKIANTDPIPIDADKEFEFYSEFIEQSSRYPYNEAA